MRIENPRNGMSWQGLATRALVLLALPGAAAAAVLAESGSNDTSGTANSADPGADCFSYVSGSLSPGTDQDFYSVPAASGERLWVATDTGGTQAAGAASRDTVATLLDTDGSTVLETDDNDGSGNGGDAFVESGDASVIAGRAAPSAGTYFVRLAANGGVVDPYRLVVATTTGTDVNETEGNDSIGTANNAPGCNVPLIGAIATSGDIDTYLVPLTQGQLLFVVVDVDPERDAVSGDLAVDLLNAAGAVIFGVDSSSDSASAPAAESLTYFAPATANYFVRIRAVSGAGTYRALIAPSTETGFADLSVDLADSVDPVLTGYSVSYTMTVSNQSQIVDATGVEVTFTASAGTVGSATGTNWTCTLGPPVNCTYAPTLLANATSTDITVSMTAPSSAGVINASATVAGDPPDDSPLNNEFTETTTVNAPADGGGGGGYGGGGALDVSLLLGVLASLGRAFLLRRRAPGRKSP